jgi:hypothetical protein
MLRGGILLALCLLASTARAVKLKFRDTECVFYSFNQYEYFYGSYVSLPDAYGVSAKYDLLVTAPSGTKLYELTAEAEATFHLVPVESGSHKFCLTVNYDKSGTHYRCDLGARPHAARCAPTTERCLGCPAVCQARTQ